MHSKWLYYMYVGNNVIQPTVTDRLMVLGFGVGGWSLNLAGCGRQVLEMEILYLASI